MIVNLSDWHINIVAIPCVKSQADFKKNWLHYLILGKHFPGETTLQYSDTIDTPLGQRYLIYGSVELHLDWKSNKYSTCAHSNTHAILQYHILL